jgi:hypothetical protein
LTHTKGLKAAFHSASSCKTKGVPSTRWHSGSWLPAVWLHLALPQRCFE